MDAFTLLLIFFCVGAFVGLLPALRDAVVFLVNAWTAAAERKRRQSLRP
jgi:hypothetical protein